MFIPLICLYTLFDCAAITFKISDIRNPLFEVHSPTQLFSGSMFYWNLGNGILCISRLYGAFLKEGYPMIPPVKSSIEVFLDVPKPKSTIQGAWAPTMETYENTWKYMTGWWFGPLWKIWTSIGMIPNIWENKIDVPNHQPDDTYISQKIPKKKQKIALHLEKTTYPNLHVSHSPAAIAGSPVRRVRRDPRPPDRQRGRRGAARAHISRRKMRLVWVVFPQQQWWNKDSPTIIEDFSVGFITN